MTDTIQRSASAAAGASVHERVVSAVEDAIAGGTLRAGDRLPTHRALAQQLSVSIGSVTRAIDALSARGVVRSEVGRGTFVAQVPATAESAGTIDLSVNAPAPVIGPGQLEAAARIASERSMRLANGGYVDLAGTSEQRAVIAGWLSQTRSAFDSESILLCNGAQQGLHLSMALLQGEISAVVTEPASFPGAIAAAGNLGLTLRAVANDAQGPLPEALAAVLAETGPAAVYLTPVCQNPMGYETGVPRRRALAEIVERYGAFIIEDDIYGIYARQRGPLYRDLLPERCFYVTSFSKSLTPLVRVGVLAPPPTFLAAARKRMRAESWGLPPFVIEMVVSLIETGAVDVAVGQMRREARERLAIVREALPDFALPMPEGAPHVWLPLDPLRAEQIARRASEAGIRIGPPSAMQVGSAPVAGIRLCIMMPPQPALQRAVETIARLLAEEDEVVV